MPIKNDRLLKALAMQPVDRTPIWLMRQAGRYLPEYREVRRQAGNFTKLCKNPELACEVTLQPIRRYAFDAAIIFSDILTIPDAMGLGLQVIEKQGPMFERPLQNEQAIEKVNVPEPDRLSYVYEAIKLVKQALCDSIPLIGFCGSPWTLAVYMVEGRSKPGFPLAQHMRQNSPAIMHQLLDKLAIAVSNHCLGQIQAGANVIMLFDTWGGLLNTPDYEQFSLKYVKKIINSIHQHYNKRDVPIILFTRSGHQWLPQMSETGCHAIGVDWQISMREARQMVKETVAIQGNLNPAVLLQSAETIRNAVLEIIRSYGPGNGHIFNLGHGITPEVPPENVTILVEAVREFSQQQFTENKVKHAI